jgi:hypothetical protein
MRTQGVELILVRATDDAPLFSTEYQAELNQFASHARASSTRVRLMAAAVGGDQAGLLGEFLFNHADLLITALSNVGVAWLTARAGRKLRLKFDGIEVEANNAQEATDMLQQVREFRDHQEKS